MRPLTEKPEHGALIGIVRDGGVVASRELQLYLDAITLQMNQNLLNGVLMLSSYTVTTVPSASSVGAGAVIYVTDESGGPTIASSDGTDWRRSTDNAVIT